ncbi:MAG TPA: C13 family peptidase [Stellaceae bacterium]|nr:C13 family peptidase [Stellaceae bacterium]
MAQSVKLTSELQAPSGKIAGPKRLFYIGLALFSEKWSENDIVDLAMELRRSSDYDLVPLMASNVVASLPETYPIADDAAIEALVDAAAEHAKDGDLVFVYISTHGRRGALSRKIDAFSEQQLPADALSQLLQPLAGRRTVIFLSACFSGSLLSELKSDDRIIVTAARADRASFGCRPTAQHTYFGEAVLRSFGHRERSLQRIIADVSAEVAGLERAYG